MRPLPVIENSDVFCNFSNFFLSASIVKVMDQFLIECSPKAPYWSVIMVQDLTIPPFGSGHVSQRQAKAKGFPNFITIRMGNLRLPTCRHSQDPSARTRQPRRVNASESWGTRLPSQRGR